MCAAAFNTRFERVADDIEWMKNEWYPKCIDSWSAAVLQSCWPDFYSFCRLNFFFLMRYCWPFATESVFNSTTIKTPFLCVRKMNESWSNWFIEWAKLWLIFVLFPSKMISTFLIYFSFYFHFLFCASFHSWISFYRDHFIEVMLICVRLTSARFSTWIFIFHWKWFRSLSSVVFSCCWLRCVSLQTQLFPIPHSSLSFIQFQCPTRYWFIHSLRSFRLRDISFTCV